MPITLGMLSSAFQKCSESTKDELEASEASDAYWNDRTPRLDE